MCVLPSPSQMLAPRTSRGSNSEHLLCCGPFQNSNGFTFSLFVMLSPTNFSGHTTIPPNTSSHAVPSYCSTNQDPVNFHVFNSGSYPRLRSSFFWFWAPLFHDVALVVRCIWTVIVAFLVLIACASYLNRAYLEVVSFFSFASNCFRHFQMQAWQVPWLVSCLTIATDVWSNTESFIVPVAIWSCTMRGFWNSLRFLRIILWQVCMALLPAHVAHVFNLTALVATVAFDYENGGEKSCFCMC